MEQRYTGAIKSAANAFALKKDEPVDGLGDRPFEEIEQRASAKTEILRAMLAEQETPSWSRYWGLNE